MSTVGSVECNGIEQIVNLQKPQQSEIVQQQKQQEIQQQQTEQGQKSPDDRIGVNIDIKV